MVVLLIHGIKEKNKFKHVVSEEEYEIFVNLVKWEFNTPGTNAHDFKKNANIKFWRVKSKYAVDNSTQTMLFYNWKRVLKNNGVKKRLLQKLFTKVNRLGTRR